MTPEQARAYALSAANTNRPTWRRLVIVRRQHPELGTTTIEG
jgi:hypothetical protein